MATILYVDDEPAIGLILQDSLERMGHVAIGASNVPEALRALEGRAIDLIISDFKMPGLSGLEFLEMLRQQGRDIPLIMLTGYATIEHAVAAIKAGAADYITKPMQPEQLEHAVTTALELTRLKRENDALRLEVMEIRAARQIIAKSEGMMKVLQAVSSAAPTRATVLLLGESGTGKELLARAIHDQSDRRDKAFVQLNCAAMPEGLVESALFGHEKGAFTGAIKRVEGAFERAHRGTLLLDEVTEMRIDLQGKLLRVLQEQEFERVGGSATISVDVRIIATSNRDIEQAVERGEFRRDLYYRLSVLPIYIPPLRERPEDVAILAHHFALRAAPELNRTVTRITPDAIKLLQKYSWPGNVRELQHAVERAVIMSSQPELSPGNFDQINPARRSTPIRGVPEASALDVVTVPSLNIDEAESALIKAALKATGGNRTRAAALLGVTDRTLRNKLSPSTKGSGKDR
jgi:DNA-binding NtrC family response regulator